MTLFSERLKKARKEKGFLQRELAEMLSVRQGSYTHWETGKREPNFKKLILLAKYLDVSTDFLLGVTNIKGERNIMFSFFKRDKEREVEILPTISGNYILTDTLSDSKDNLLTAKQARELVDSVDSNFKEGLFKTLRWCAENGYFSHMVFRHEQSNKTELLTYEYCVGVGKTELEELGYTVEIDCTSVTISW